MGIIQPPSIAPTVSSGVERDDHWRSYDNSVNAVSFGFVATAILISMFLIMAIFERFLRQRPSDASGRSGSDLEAQSRIHGKLEYPSPKMNIYSRGVSVLMPGEEIPTFIAHPAPKPCPPDPERVSRPLHQKNMLPSLPSNTSIV